LVSRGRVSDPLIGPSRRNINLNTQDSFTARLNQVAEDTEALLDKLLSPALPDGEQARPQRLLDSMRYGSLAGQALSPVPGGRVGEPVRRAARAIPDGRRRT